MRTLTFIIFTLIVSFSFSFQEVAENSKTIYYEDQYFYKVISILHNMDEDFESNCIVKEMHSDYDYEEKYIQRHLKYLKKVTKDPFFECENIDEEFITSQLTDDNNYKFDTNALNFDLNENNNNNKKCYKYSKPIYLNLERTSFRFNVTISNSFDFSTEIEAIEPDINNSFIGISVIANGYYPKYLFTYPGSAEIHSKLIRAKEIRDSLKLDYLINH